MPRMFAFLRAVNVGGRTVPMARLKALFEELGLRDAATFIASGNVVFDAAPEEETALAARIEAHLKASLGFDVAVFLRSEAELATLLAGCPFDAAEAAGAGALNVAFLRAPLTAAQATLLAELRSDVDDFRSPGREVWWRCKVRQSESAFSNAVFEKALGLKATFRGWSTLQRLGAKHLPSSD